MQSERKDSESATQETLGEKPLTVAKRASVDLSKSEEDFLDLIERVQGSRLEEQRAELPPLKPEKSGKSIQDDDCFDQMMLAQCDRMDDQRATMTVKEDGVDKAAQTKK